MSFYGDPFDARGAWSEENQIGRLWARFMAYLDHNSQRILHCLPEDVAYEVHVYGEETMTQGLFEIFVGVQVERLESPPVELLAKVLPASHYAVFTFHGEQITSDWVWEIDRWLAESGCQRSHPYSFQRYDRRFKGMDRIAESTLDVYLPVLPPADAGADE